MKYPPIDFRYLISHNTGEEVILSMSREPLDLLLEYWEKSERPPAQYQLYYSGIKRGVAHYRYSMDSLLMTSEYPEFNGAIVEGLKELWRKLNVFLKGEVLYIDCKEHNLLLSKEEMDSLMFCGDMVQIEREGVLREYQVVFSKRAESIRKTLYIKDR